MAAPRPWTVLPHGPIERLEENLWAVSGALPRGQVSRRMAVIRLGDDRLVFHNAIPLAEDAMAELQRFGRAAFLIVPNRFHRVDVHAFRERHPGIRVVCPPAARAHVEARVAVDGGLDLLPPDPALVPIPLDGSRAEAALLVRSAGRARASLVFADTVMNLPHLGGVEGLLLRFIGSTGEPCVTPLARRVSVRDPRALSAHLARLADTPGLVRLLVSHGTDVTEDAPGVLRRVAAGLGGYRGRSAF